nr:MAG TPA: hypothetical protein [Caudoviricetes sp.]
MTRSRSECLLNFSISEVMESFSLIRCKFTVYQVERLII